MKTLSDRLIDARLAAGFTQREAAHRAGVSRATISNAETGRYEAPALGTLAALARVYRVGLGSLLPHETDRSDVQQAAPETDRAPAPTAS